jgi:hypothetical protein
MFAIKNRGAISAAMAGRRRHRPGFNHNRSWKESGPVGTSSEISV